MEYCHSGRECINIIAKESVKDFVDLTNVTHSKPGSVRDVWIMIDDISLTVVDKTILTTNEWLMDSHIRAAQYLLQQQHPGISGFLYSIHELLLFMEIVNLYNVYMFQITIGLRYLLWDVLQILS